MMTLKAKKAKSKYKNTDAWIEAVYRNNKTTIDQELSFAGKPKQVFKQMVKEYMSEGLSAKKAVNTIARSTLFTPEVERLHNNMLSGLKSDKDAYKVFRDLTREKGRYSKFDESKLQWNKDEKAYIYDNKVLISFDNSPYGVKVGII